MNLDDSDIIQLFKSWEKRSDQVLARFQVNFYIVNCEIKIRDKAYNRDEINDRTSSLDAAKAIYRLVNILYLVEAYQPNIYPTISATYTRKEWQYLSHS